MSVLTLVARRMGPMYCTTRPLNASGKAREQSVKGWAIEALSEVGTGCQEQLTAGIRLVELGQDRSPHLLTEATFEHERPLAELKQQGCERIKVFGPLGEHEHVAAALHRICDVTDDLPSACVVLNQRSKDILDRCDLTRPCQAFRIVNDESAGECGAGCVGERNFVAYRATLHCDDRLQPVAAIGRRGQSKPPPGRCFSHRQLKRSRRQVMTLIDDHQPITGDQLADVTPPGDGLQRGDVHDTTRLARSSQPSDLLAGDPKM